MLESVLGPSSSLANQFLCSHLVLFARLSLVLRIYRLVT